MMKIPQALVKALGLKGCALRKEVAHFQYHLFHTAACAAAYADGEGV